jgi:HK97 family phage major capsid protein
VRLPRMVSRLNPRTKKENTLPTIAELRTSRAKLITDAQALAIAGVTSETRTQIDAMIADAAVIAGDIATMESLDQLNADLRSSQRPPQAMPGAGDTSDVELDAFRTFLRTGEKRSALRTVETRDGMVVGTPTQGGNFVPTSFQKSVEVATLAIGNALKVVGRLHTQSGEALQMPTANDTTNYAVPVTETVAVAEADVPAGQSTINTEMYSTGMVKVSRQLLRDAGFDLQGFLAAQFATRWNRGLNKTITLGSTSTNTQGLLVAGTINAAANVQASGTGGTLNVPAYSDILSLFGALDPSYRDSATWMFSNAYFIKLLGVVDGYGRPLLIPNVNGAGFDAILGRPICINQAFPTLAASTVQALFGNFEKYVLRDVGAQEIVRLEERFADTIQVGFFGYQSFGGKLLDAGTHPIASITAKAS